MKMSTMFMIFDVYFQDTYVSEMCRNMYTYICTSWHCTHAHMCNCKCKGSLTHVTQTCCWMHMCRCAQATAGLCVHRYFSAGATIGFTPKLCHSRRKILLQHVGWNKLCGPNNRQYTDVCPSYDIISINGLSAVQLYGSQTRFRRNPAQLPTFPMM